MRSPATAAVLCLTLVTACGASEDKAQPESSPSVSLWGTAGPPAGKPPKGGTEPFDADRAVLRIKRLGYTADTKAGTLKNLRGPFRAIHAHCSGSVDGTCVSVFFFYGNEYAGYDVPAAAQSAIVSQDGETVTLSYPRYLPTDPQCCHSGGEREYRARWKDGKVVFSPPLPENPNYPDT
ncbi:LppP/LprE family lipoprotein [Streptomyces sp. ALI-76-A]|uniref:LppP/LprE family lipoprotein n=1 Tax=Streptomyces sp. ALI-76-A TaxID=3025736 RepID=UPI00256EFE13|nr:LppP/LprE family lipoprotein [Streptomyces sp. ALI-76-A]MDL5199100.1 LppP/LprE family lipoprotein [Streptomyces sp. ALI-76-A]